MLDTLQRFEQKYEVGDSGYWLWKGWKTLKGYGGFHYKGRDEHAHRVSYQLYINDIPPNMCVLHSCDTPACVNPDHLFLGTQQDNMKDKEKKGRAPKGKDHYSWVGDKASPNTLAARKYKAKIKSFEKESTAWV